jgi:metal-responsive CopG/Arc/MetJ family transcriptional regulator
MILIPAELDRRIDKMVYEAKMKNIPLSRSGVVAQALQAYFAADLGESGNG